MPLSMRYFINRRGANQLRVQKVMDRSRTGLFNSDRVVEALRASPTAGIPGTHASRYDAGQNESANKRTRHARHGDSNQQQHVSFPEDKYYFKIFKRLPFLKLETGGNDLSSGFGEDGRPILGQLLARRMHLYVSYYGLKEALAFRKSCQDYQADLQTMRDLFTESLDKGALVGMLSVDINTLRDKHRKMVEDSIEETLPGVDLGVVHFDESESDGVPSLRNILSKALPDPSIPEPRHNLDEWALDEMEKSSSMNPEYYTLRTVDPNERITTMEYAQQLAAQYTRK